MKRKLTFATIAIAVAVVLAVGSPAAAAELVQVDAFGTTVTFTPLRPAYGWSLRVSAPNGQVFSQDFLGKEIPSFAAFDEFGALLPDGSYTWELVAMPAPRGRDTTEAGAARLSQSGSFRMEGGAAVFGGAEEVPTKDQVFLDDVIVDGSLCVGVDCVNGESFGFDTIRLKENNLRIKAQDTSSSASFPTNDWQITFNESSNGGQNKFSIDDIDGGRTPFTIEAGAPSHSLYVDDGGRIGLGTSTPVVEVHIKDGDTPTLRLEQDGSSGFTPQTWDVAGNETNFFIRDVTNGSTLPLRIRPGAPTSAIDVAGDGDIGIGTSSPSTQLHIRRTNGNAGLRVEEASGTVGNSRIMIQAENNGEATVRLINNNTADTWDFKVNSAGGFVVNDPTQAGVEFLVLSDGQVRLKTVATAPAGCVEGALYADDSGALCYCETGGSWVVAAGGGTCV